MTHYHVSDNVAPGSKMLDITAPDSVEIQIRGDGRVLWININGLCALRASSIGTLDIIDERPDP